MTPDERERYSRQIRFQSWGEDGQEALLRRRVAVVGCGALGSSSASALVRAGVGFIRLIDRDYVELSNLQRQSLYTEEDAQHGLPKALAAAKYLSAASSSCLIEDAIVDLSSENVDDLLGDVDLVLDGTDNFQTRYLINDFAISRKLPWIYGAAVGSYGLAMPILSGRTPCLACIYPHPPTGAQQTCDTAGVLNPATSIIGALQAAHAMKILTGHADEVEPRITTVDVWTGVMKQIFAGERDPDCRACGREEWTHLHAQERVPISLCGRNAVQIHEKKKTFNLHALAQKLAALGEVRVNEFAIRFFAPPHEVTIFADGRAIIKGTTDVGVARSLYARYVGC